MGSCGSYQRFLYCGFELYQGFIAESIRGEQHTLNVAYNSIALKWLDKLSVMHLLSWSMSQQPNLPSRPVFMLHRCNHIRPESSSKIGVSEMPDTARLILVMASRSLPGCFMMWTCHPRPSRSPTMKHHSHQLRRKQPSLLS